MAKGKATKRRAPQGDIIGTINLERGEVESYEETNRDVTVPGGAYFVNGKFVNAHGQVLHVTKDGQVLHIEDECDADEGEQCAGLATVSRADDDED